ncbi:uncharacterized protein I303_101522 [Kwoniella dejecticola CBS 10117]|uniref:Uncharacterized protein n=1 Tax=Kwoniella dejecticola CBS 10117 TaxID=1296121 RepID=A0A1A6ADI0_9TREE|nr:uncharacterized protein I303_02346 [Kwoniella dejecticola CBS 10117]OBR88127.1 hypothetical protein I303_02346 [Kwoniella dejecticola CBS 10117]
MSAYAARSATPIVNPDNTLPTMSESATRSRPSKYTESILYYSIPPTFSRRSIPSVWAHGPNIQNNATYLAYQHALDERLTRINKSGSASLDQFVGIVNSLDAELGTTGSEGGTSNKKQKKYPGCRSKFISQDAFQSLAKLIDISAQHDSCGTGCWIMYIDEETCKPTLGSRRTVFGLGFGGIGGSWSCRSHRNPQLVKDGSYEVRGIGSFVNPTAHPAIRTSTGPSPGSIIVDDPDIVRSRAIHLQRLQQKIAADDRLRSVGGINIWVKSDLMEDYLMSYTGQGVGIITLHTNAMSELHDCIDNSPQPKVDCGEEPISLVGVDHRIGDIEPFL